MASKNPFLKGIQTIQGYIEMFPVIAYGAYLARQDNSFDSLAPSIFFALISVTFVVPAVAFILRFGAQLFKDQELTIENALLPAAANCYGTVFGEKQLGRELLKEVGIDLSNQAEQAVNNPPSLIFIMGGGANAGKRAVGAVKGEFISTYNHLSGKGNEASSDELKVTRGQQFEKQQAAFNQKQLESNLNLAQRKYDRAANNLHNREAKIKEMESKKRPENDIKPFRDTLPTLKNIVSRAESELNNAKGQLGVADNTNSSWRNVFRRN